MWSLIESFNSVFGVRNKWVKVSPRDMKENPELADEVFDLLTRTYKPIGGHTGFKKALDFVDNGLVVYGIDVSSGPEMDAFTVYKKKPQGLKSVASGTSGSSKAKVALVKKKLDAMNTSGMYGEVSGAIAHVMLTRGNPTVVVPKRRVEAVLGKKVEWIGKHPDGKYPKANGWYRRKIGGKVHMKIMLGKPKLK